MPKRIQLFTQPGCPPCHTAKAYLAARGVAYEERDVTRDPQAVRDLIGKYGSQTTPTFVIDDVVLVGFDPRRLDELLGPVDA